MSYVIGLDIGGTTIKGGVFTGASDPIAEMRVKTYQHENTRDEILDSIATVIDGLITEAGSLLAGELAGVGIGVPGYVKSSEGVVREAANLDLTNTNLRDWVEKRYSVPSVVQGDARAGALAEHRFGAAHGTLSSLYVVIGTGIGSGMILNGQIYEGVHALAGEIGHTIVNPSGLTCACGKQGCLETVVSGPVIIRAYQERTQSTRENSAKAIAKLAAEGNADAIAIFAEVARTLAVALANYATIVDPSIIVIGGGVSLAGWVLFNPLREFFPQYASAEAAKTINIVPAKLADKSGIVGASLLVEEFLYTSNLKGGEGVLGDAENSI